MEITGFYLTNAVEFHDITDPMASEAAKAECDSMPPRTWDRLTRLDRPTRRSQSPSPTAACADPSIRAERSEYGQRTVELVDDPVGLVSHLNLTVKLPGQGAEQTRAKSSPGWRDDRRAAGFRPSKAE